MQGDRDMNHKYVISFDSDKTKLVLREYLEMEPGLIEFTCEETYELDIIKNAIESGMSTLIATFRTHNIYPTGFLAEKLGEAIITLFLPDAKESVEVLFNDKDAIAKEEEEELVVENEIADADEILKEEEESDDLDVDTIFEGVDIPKEVSDKSLEESGEEEDQKNEEQKEEKKEQKEVKEVKEEKKEK